MSVEPIIGIDLGTSNSVVAVLEGENVKVILNSEGMPKTPSVVSISENGEVQVGEIARRQASIAPQRTISSVKRLIGRSLADVESLGLRFPYELAMHEHDLLVRIDDRGFKPSQISAYILNKLKQAAEDHIGGPVTKAVLTVPAYFDDLQRQATREAAELAGLEVVRLLNEPTAAAMAYGLGRGTTERIAVFDFGGGTFDLTVLDISENAFEVITTAGDTHLGGDDIDEALVTSLLQTFASQTGYSNYIPDAMALRRLKDAAEKAKCDLSSSKQATVSLPFLSQADGSPLHLETILTRDMLEEIAAPFVERCLDICEDALLDVNLTPDEVNRVLLVGGSTRMPIVQELVEDYFGKPPFKGLNPDEVVAIGAATQAGVMSGKLKEVILLDVTPHSLGVEVEGGRCVKIIEKNSTIPVKQGRMFTTIEDNQDLVMVHVVQGESDRTSENRSLGKFSLGGITGGRAGAARVQITFSINADGMVEVLAEDLATKVSRSVQLLITGDENGGVSRKRTDFSSSRRRGRTSGKATRRAGSTPTRNPDSAPSRGSRAPSGPAPVGYSSGQNFTPTSLNLQAIPLSSSQPAPVQQPQPPAQQPVQASIPDSSARGANVGNTSIGTPLSYPAKIEPVIRPSQDPPTAVPDWNPREAPMPQGGLDSSTPVGNVAGTNSGQDGGALVKGKRDPRESQAATNAQTLSAQARAAVEKINSGVVGDDALRAYSAVAEELRAYATANLGDKSVSTATVRILVMLGEQAGARKLLLAMGEDTDCDAGALSDLYEVFLKRFPRDNEATSGFAATLSHAGRVDEAIEKLEKVTTEDGASSTQVEGLIQLYRSRLATTPDDHDTQFKLVKLLIRSGKIDEAVNLLQRLVNVESYRTRALKILGLCFWQKGLHYLAWQKLQQLPLNDEIRDILYRLSQDMEDTDQVLNAKVVLQHIVQDNPAYRDVGERLKRVEHMIRMESGNGDTNLTPSIFLTMKDSRFIILEEINRGSMGIVYRSKDKVLDEIVALKILNDYMTADETAVERFKREARAAKRLAHPNIVRIHDMFEYADKKILSMEYIEGRDLKKVLLERRQLPDLEVARIGKAVADALGYAHGLSVVHRDIKPANIMITSDNRVKVTDFGIAKLLLAGNDATRSGSQIIGTPLYMSPEQIRGISVDARTDIYSLGATMYEAATGRPPFIEGNIEYHHLHTPPPPLPSSVGPILGEAIMKCLEKDPNQRWSSTAELVQALDKVK